MQMCSNIRFLPWIEVKMRYWKFRKWFIFKHIRYKCFARGLHCTYLGITQKQPVISLHQSYYRVKRCFLYKEEKCQGFLWILIENMSVPTNFTTSPTFTTLQVALLHRQSMLLLWQQEDWSWILLARRLSNPYFSTIADCGVLFHCLQVLTLWNCAPAIIKWHPSTYSSLEYPQIMTVKIMYNTNIWQLVGNK